MAGLPRWSAAAALAISLSVSPAAWSDEATAVYQAYWAGLPAGAIRLTLHNEAASYRDEIAVRSQGLAWLLTRFRATARSDGRLAAGQLPAPARYDALYDLRKAHDKRLSMRFARRAGVLVAERGPEDGSSKPPLAQKFRENVLDPLSVLTAIQHELRQGRRGTFTVPAYDGARRFDVVVHVLPKHEGDAALHVELTLAPIAGFKGEASDDPDPDNAPRPVDLTMSNDGRLMPLSMSVSIAHLPLVVELAQWCGNPRPCDW